MQFREVKQGYSVYLLDKSLMKVQQVRVIGVGVPYNEPPKVGQLSNINRLVDVTIEQEGRNHVYAIPETACVTYAGETVLSTDADGILREIKAVKSQSEEVLASVDAHREKVLRCEEIIGELDTAYKDKKEMDSRLSKVEEFMLEMKEDIKSLVRELKA